MRIYQWLRIKNLIKGIFVLSLVFSAWTSAYALDNYTVLEPLPGTTIDKNCTGDKCQTDLEHYLPGLFNWAIGIAAVMAFVVITFGGITYMTTDALGPKSQGREMIERAIWGLVLVIGSYIILYTINPQILEFNLTLKRPNISTSTVYTTSSTGVLQGYVMNQDMIDQDKVIRQKLENVTAQFGVVVHPIAFNSSACTTGATKGCTNVYGMPVVMQDALLDLALSKDNCDCQIRITGGTEGGHAEHGPGKAVVDISPNQKLNAFLAKTNSNASNPHGAPDPTRVTVAVARRDGSGAQRATFTFEEAGDNDRASGTHWHVTIP